VLSPVLQRRARNLFLVLTLLLHGGIALTMNLWPHSYVIMVFNLLMLPPQTLERMQRARWWDPIRAVGARLRRRLPRKRPRPPPLPWMVMAREGAVAVMFVAVAFRIGHDNAALPSALRPADLGALSPLITYPRLYQRWSMFKEAPVTDGTIVVDAVTISGQRIDPLTGAPPDLSAPLHGPWGQSQIECDYYLKIQRPRLARYRPALRRYLEHWHELHDRGPSDELASFTVYWVSNRSPAPGATAPTNIHRRVLLRFP
jgi:hypothetical protein